MGNPTKNATLRGLIKNVLTDLMIKTTAYNVYLDEDTTVAVKMNEMCMAINDREKIADVNEKLSSVGIMETFSGPVIQGDFVAGMPLGYRVYIEAQQEGERTRARRM